MTIQKMLTGLDRIILNVWELGNLKNVFAEIYLNVVDVKIVTLVSKLLILNVNQNFILRMIKKFVKLRL